MARVVLENVRVDFPIYGAQRNLRKVLFDRATGGLIQRQGKNQDQVVVKALAGVSMTLEDGDRIGLIGHNGSGKSTLLKVLAGIYEPIAGKLLHNMQQGSHVHTKNHRHFSCRRQCGRRSSRPPL